MFVARGHSGALIRLDEDGHGVAVGDGATDGVGVGDVEGLAMADGSTAWEWAKSRRSAGCCRKRRT